ncbi:hypothetical protein AB0G85_03565 [Streptomyces sioyaensis]|uniref:hypothetical protein n=1 Tax=Streptomyces sioyaensis TaxID=67364 RepID=UPI0034099AE0
MIDLLAVTGSGACGKYQHGWSDLDVFVIAEPDRNTELRQALTEVQSGLGEVKLGLTVLSQAECRAGAVTSRLLHMMTLLGTGSLLPLWARPGLTIPAPPLADDVAASLEVGTAPGGEADLLVAPVGRGKQVWRGVRINAGGPGLSLALSRGGAPRG